MRTTVTLDADVYELASVYANSKGITLSRAIGELVRHGQASKPIAVRKIRTTSGGFPLFPKQGRVITSAMVKEALEEDLG